MSLAPIWLTFNEEERPQDKWDCHGIKRVIAEADVESDGRGGVVVLAAGPNAEQVSAVNSFISALDWCLLILTADECSLFPIHLLKHPRMIVWQQTPSPSTTADRVFGYCVPDATRKAVNHEAVDRPFDWCFMGQVTHERRVAAEGIMRHMQGGLLYPTLGFSQGFTVEAYASILGMSKIAVCPAGACTPDTFRVWEALEAGCVPIIDALGPDGRKGYWDQVLGRHPLPMITDWSRLPALVNDVLTWTVTRHSRVAEWYRDYQAKQVLMMKHDVLELQR